MWSNRTRNSFSVILLRPNTQQWKMIFYSKQLSVVELIINVSIHYETDDKKNYVIILLPPFFPFEVRMHINIWPALWHSANSLSTRTPLGPAQSVRLGEMSELKRSQLIAGKKYRNQLQVLKRGVRSEIVDCKSYFKPKAFVFRKIQCISTS